MTPATPWQTLFRIDFGALPQESQQIIRFTDKITESRHEYNEVDELIRHVDFLESRLLSSGLRRDSQSSKLTMENHKRLVHDLNEYKQSMLESGNLDDSFFDFLPVWVSTQI